LLSGLFGEFGSVHQRKDLQPQDM